MKVLIIVQARMTSTRLPGKVLKTVLGKSLLEYQLERMRWIKEVDQIVIATTENETDLPIVAFCERLGIPCFRGSEDDVLARYYGAATEYGGEVIVRLTSDCPLIDPEVAGRTIRFYLSKYPKFDYVSNSLEMTFPRGMDTEVFSYQSLSEAYREATEKPEREHVTPFIYRHPERYRLANLSSATYHGDQRWVVDTPEDFEFIRRILESLFPSHPHFTMTDVLELLQRFPEWVEINRDVAQKDTSLKENQAWDNYSEVDYV